MKRKEFLKQLSNKVVVAKEHKDLGNITIYEAPTFVATGEKLEDTDILETPMKLLLVRKGEKFIASIPVSESYEFIPHKKAVEFVTNKLDEEGIKYKVVEAKDVGTYGRFLVITSEEEVDEKKVSFLVENSYNTTSSLKIYLTLVDGKTILPVSLLLRRIHLKETITKTDWERVLDEIRHLPLLLEKLKTVKTDISFISRIKEFKTTYRRKKDGEVVEEVVEVGQMIYSELLSELGPTPTVYDLWVGLAKKNYEKRRGLTLLIKRRIEKLLLHLFETYRKRVEGGISVKFIIPVVSASAGV